MLRPRKVHYIVKPEDKVVVCISEDNSQVVDEVIWAYCNDKHIGVTNTFIDNRFVGVARCHPDDEWDELIGKQVAYEKLCRKLTVAYNSKLKEISRNMKRLAEIVDEQIVQL